MSNQAAEQTINIASLPVHELKKILDQMQQEFEILSNSVQSLKSLQGQYVESKTCVDVLKSAEKGKEVLVPLSSSLYVPGNLNDNENVLVDIGTGYFVEKSVQDADEFFNRKIDYLKEKIESLQGVLQQKFQAKQIVTETLQAKILQHSQQQQQTRA